MENSMKYTESSSCSMSDLDIEILNNVANPEPGWASTLTPGVELFDVNECCFPTVVANDSTAQLLTLKYPWEGTDIRSYKYVEDACVVVN